MIVLQILCGLFIYVALFIFIIFNMPSLERLLGDTFVITYWISVFLGLIPAVISYNKGRIFLNWWVYGTFLFLIALIHSIVIKSTEDQLIIEGMKKCPFCAELIKPDAIVCRYCGRDLPIVEQVKENLSPYQRTAIENKSIEQ